MSFAHAAPTWRTPPRRRRAAQADRRRSCSPCSCSARCSPSSTSSSSGPSSARSRDRERMLTALKQGDRVITTGGLHGTVTGLSEHTVTLRVADQVKLEFDRSAIGRIVEGHGRQGCLETSGSGSALVGRRAGYLALVPVSPRSSGSTSVSTCRAASTWSSAWRPTRHVSSQTERAAEDLKNGARAQGRRGQRVARDGLSSIVVAAGQPDQLERRASRSPPSSPASTCGDARRGRPGGSRWPCASGEVTAAP